MDMKAITTRYAKTYQTHTAPKLGSWGAVQDGSYIIDDQRYSVKTTPRGRKITHKGRNVSDATWTMVMNTLTNHG